MNTPRQLTVVNPPSANEPSGPRADAMDSAGPQVTLRPVQQSRRQFCAHACQAASLVAAGAFLPACGGGDSPTSPGPVSGNTSLATLNGTVSGRTVTVSVAPGGPLSAAGNAALVNSGLGPFLVSRTSQTTFTVLTAICTHEQCTVTDFNGTLYVCPCHNSKYTTSGTVANGPANRALTQFPATFAADVLTFNA